MREYDRHEGAVVYYHPASGNTHLLTDAAAAILRLLAEKPLSEDELINRIGGENPIIMLEELESFSLVEAV
jgi:hypothetical protein